ncbi:nitrite reductase (NADH) small subunit [Galbitalea soli]|nr:nitrite reductase small subunit NirD [Galbitalea soli]NYJ31410.1 nitrite reductase (NADH) small subunit [Galbitalea soli]
MTLTATTAAHADATSTVWLRACPVDELEPAFGEAVLLRGRQIALFLISPEEIYAVSNIDPVASAPVMARGIVGSRGDRRTIASPLHKEVYDLSSGECLTEPGVMLETFPTRVVGGVIEVEVTG